MAKARKKHSNEFKARIALEAQQGLKPISEIAAANGIHANMVSQWKSELTKNAAQLFGRCVVCVCVPCMYLFQLNLTSYC